MSDVMISTSALTKRFGDVQALDQVEFEVHKGEVVGFLGPNGAGKSTTMRILTCFISPSSGSATVNRPARVGGATPGRVTASPFRSRSPPR